MEQQSSTSKVTVEYFDPHNVYQLLSPGLIPRLPLRNLHWQSHAGPLRSIDTLHVELVQGGSDPSAAPPALTLGALESTSRDDGFQTQQVGGHAGSTEAVDAQSIPSKATGSQRRHQIPGLRRTPYLKVLLVRCDDNDSYKSTVRSEVREWIKTHTPPSTSSKKSSNQEKHDAFEWLIVHVVIPNTVAATQPRSGSSKTDGSNLDKSSSRWRTGSTPLMEKFRSDFNSSSKGAPDRVAQLRIGINDVPYDMLPRVVPAVPSGYSETDQDAETAWNDLVGKLKSLILSSFDQRVTQYEEDIKEKDGQRSLPGWNFCTFFILKEGLARGFESVGLVEDALVGYDELNVGLDSVTHEQAVTRSPESHGSAMLSYTNELKMVALKALAQASGEDGDGEAEDLQSKESAKDQSDDIVISSTKKAYRDMILANKVSVFDFRCYIFARQISLLLRSGNALSTREELMARLRDQQNSILHGVTPLAPPSDHDDGPENLSMLAEICKRTLEFIPAISQVMRQDVVSAVTANAGSDKATWGSSILDPVWSETVDNLVSSFAFSVAQQILAQTSTRALPIPTTVITPEDGHEPKSSIPEPKTMMHPARTSSLHVQPSPRPPPSPGVFPGPGRRVSDSDTEAQNSKFLKVGLEELSARRAELYLLSRSILDGLGKKRGWSNGWDEAPIVGEPGVEDMDDVSLDGAPASAGKESAPQAALPSAAGVESRILRTATDNADDFYRLYEILTDKALRHYTVANHGHAVHTCLADLAILKVHMKEYRAARDYFSKATWFFGESGWSSLELSMLVMYSQCLSELQSNGDYVRVALNLLTKACAAERERLREKSALLLRTRRTVIPDMSPLQGVLGKIFSLAKTLATEVKVPLASFFTNVQLAGAPQYHDKCDICSLSITLHSLLPEAITLDAAKIKITCTDGGPCRDLVFEKKGQLVLTPGKNSITVDCNRQSVVPGKYRISHLGLLSSNLSLHYERDANHAAATTTDILKDANVTLFRRTGALDVRVSATKHICLDKNSSLDLELFTGWNPLKSCEVRVRPATGGLRLLTTEAKFVDSSMEFAKPPESGAFFFGSMAKETSMTLRFPYSVEQDLADVLAKLEVTYVTESDETFYLAKSLTVAVSLALGVNVQDVFKHQALFSRFNVSTASSSPLRLYNSELLESELFESSFGVPPTNPITVFPKQPAGLLYKVKRKAGSKAGKRSGKTMYLKLHYSVLQTEVEELITASVKEGLRETPLQQYSTLVEGHVLSEVRKGLQEQDLERAALLGELTTAFLDGVPWARLFHGLGAMPGSNDDASTKLSEHLDSWQKKHPRIAIPSSSAAGPCSILIPVEIPALSVVHTADMRLQAPVPSLLDDSSSVTPTVCVNQMLPATLHLRWTRAWDTDTPQRDDQEFSYEITAPADTWLLGGRRKGRFVIPGSCSPSSAPPSASTITSSTPETEAEIPLILIPRREGWLPYPSVDIREIVTATGAGGEEATQACEVDWRNLGETVHVVSENKGVTVSLDASGPGGGPLVFESERMGRRKGRIVA
ncbi:Trafficking protein particle complex subunit 10 [Tolypocladium capitatum]|uniref:Trafficking protein particle complex subunit 10 n=1 Tax=Tolypocladium capitatum TaxID=45235 RepID=A0A2K3Q6U2_9HYPO|nr:Trafficking protein particle complex subunit 10 [Tolypocladium capitatum]